MKKSLFSVLLLSATVALAACSKKAEETAQTAEPADVPMSAAPADVAIKDNSEDAAVDSAQATDTVAVADGTATEAEPVPADELADENGDIAEAIEFDDEAAATATADAEVVDESETTNK
ncbi:hypothetical protein NKT77_09220 [Moraxella sp. FZLJ2107]|uniref:hypothetical protein n=1 Tax=unclassified Moraxella TaxID=2685852 RepID=UPI0020C83C6E|nr:MULTISPECIES: hypothetical protein [unclassified Moraxella]UTO04673.1 hypothetical protein NKT77_09220 [Moraxella sp. FZLJ2107]UTO21401.1 hypothetical protein NKU06_06005 [Moraxella sp. FZLJ2109]